MIKKDYVEFLSAGTFVSESTTKEINGWDVNKALEIAKSITERYESHPYGFRFFTRGREDYELDSRIIEKSGTYYINGTVETLDEIKAKNDPNNRILISNMECNKWNKVVTTCNPYKWTQPLYENDKIVNL